MGYGLWAVSCGLWAVGCGLWAVGYGLWTMGEALMDLNARPSSIPRPSYQALALPCPTALSPLPTHCPSPPRAQALELPSPSAGQFYSIPQLLAGLPDLRRLVLRNTTQFLTTDLASLASGPWMQAGGTCAPAPPSTCLAWPCSAAA
jgi:hypothetical protein